MELIANHFSLPESAVEDVHFKQPPKMEYDEEYGVVEIVLQCVDLVAFPCVQSKKKDGGYVLRSKSAYQKAKPRILQRQVSIFVIGDDTVISVRKAEPLNDTHAEEDLFKTLYDDLAESMEQRILSLRSKSQLDGARGLAASLMEEVIEHNWNVRDKLKDWKIALELDMAASTGSFHLSQILDLHHAALDASVTLDPLSSCFRALFEETISTPSHPGVPEPSMHIPLHGAGHHVQHHATPAHRVAALRRFLTGQTMDAFGGGKRLESVLSDYRPVRDSVVKLAAEIRFTVQLCGQLNAFYSSKQNDKMNRTLYLLTLVTTLLAPVCSFIFPLFICLFFCCSCFLLCFFCFDFL